MDAFEGRERMKSLFERGRKVRQRGGRVERGLEESKLSLVVEKVVLESNLD